MRLRTAFFFVLVSLWASTVAHAQSLPADDRVRLDLSAENWVTTQTARVVLSLEAAVTGDNAGTLRATMGKTVASVAKAEWRLTSLNRTQDQAGMERWSAQYEARLPEQQIGNLAESAKKASKAGLQLSVDTIDFTPTLEERQDTLNQTRAQIYKQADEQLAVLNKTLPGRAYRIAMIDFTDSHDEGERAVPFAKSMRTMLTTARSAGGGNEAASEPAGGPEKAEKVIVTAHVVFAAAQPNVPTK